ncbi:helix-turn-helix transcriptional regulator [Brachybacterium sacelli]|uniref:DNA-binding transcriptional regulator YafY n=1 Tax=Brachybacterium sacelli TaxID=173364 RepID=A0ABS4WZI9_9MICO|nr:WYL domain-containing protein [Brachybacterium sacelli]MBP2381610.1 putative DNA-binding transcriptional regulator YafY [Brachybacterium sacelli]
MRRSERHHALLDVLRANAERPVSVPRLAARFAVSTRTVERDLRALQDAGVPLYAMPGRTGGYAIRRDYSLPPLAFTPAEATAVAAGLSVMMGSPFAEDAHRALDKVLAAMPPERRERARGLAVRVAAMAPEAPTEPDIAEVVREVLDRPRVVELEYSSHETGECTRRTVEPLGLITVRGGWILVGWCRLREGVRGFRTDRILAIERTDEVPPERSPDPLAADLSRWDFRGLDR